MGAKNTLFSYLYRDAGNYKQWGELVLKGAPDETLVLRLKKTLFDGTLFIASQVDVPDVSFEATGTYERNEDDHPWHEFDSMESTTRKPNDASKRTIEELVAQFERASAEDWSPKPSWLEW